MFDTSFVLFFVVGWDVYSRAKLKILGTTVNKQSVQALSYLRESLDGYEELRVLGKNKQFHQRFRENSLALSLSQRRAAIYSSIPRFLLELAIFLFVVVVSTGSLFFVQDFVTFIPTLALFGMASIRLLPSANALAHAIVVIRHNSNTVSLLHKDFVYGEKVKTDNEAKYKDNEHIFEQLELKNIHFSYNSNSKVILSNINLKIRAGDSIGIVGASGSGKSTLVNLVQGLLNPTAGEILVNKVPMTECIDQWHSHLAVIPQNVFLLDDSIASNVSLEFDLANIDKARLDHALKMASIYTFVKSLRDGSKTLIGEKGVFLSGGQKQRLILARAFYHNRDFLIMDEATSALDSNTEKKIVEEIIALKTKITIIIIAHRQSTIDHCDHILKVEDGRLSVYRDNK